MSTSTSPTRTTPPLSPSTTGRSRQLARAAVAAAVGFVVCLVVAGFLDPGYSQLSEGISALASVESQSAAVMIAGFMFLAATAIASGAALWSTLRGKAGRTASALVVVSGVLPAVDGFARQSCSTLQQSCLDRESAGTVSGAHVLHNLTALLLFVMLVVAGFLCSAALRRDVRFASLARPTLVVAVLSLGFMVWFGSGSYGDLGGLVQRVFALLAFGLPVVLALRLTRTTEEV